MPKVVDHTARRTAIARAFQQLLTDHGYAATTYARIAESANISVGLIQHYFADRHTLLVFAFDEMVRVRDARAEECIIAGEAAQQPIRRILDTALRELLPLDADRRREHLVGQQLRIEGNHDQSLAKVARRSDHIVHQRVRVAVINGKTCGEVHPSVAADVAATRILSTTYGLAALLAATERTTTNDTQTDHDRNPDEDAPWSEAFLDAVLDPAVGTVFTGQCRRHDPAPEPARQPQTCSRSTNETIT